MYGLPENHVRFKMTLCISSIDNLMTKQVNLIIFVYFAQKYISHCNKWFLWCFVTFHTHYILLNVGAMLLSGKAVTSWDWPKVNNWHTDSVLQNADSWKIVYKQSTYRIFLILDFVTMGWVENKQLNISLRIQLCSFTHDRGKHGEKC